MNYGDEVSLTVRNTPDDEDCVLAVGNGTLVLVPHVLGNDARSEVYSLSADVGDVLGGLDDWDKWGHEVGSGLDGLNNLHDVFELW